MAPGYVAPVRGVRRDGSSRIPNGREAMNNDQLLKFAQENDAIMKMMAKLAMEQATQYFAAQAREFAKHLPPTATGEMALTAFANAIESTNHKIWPKGQAQ
jgi:hypothetical protein